jgi:surface carbohydrate biosynthesis protein
MNGPFLLLPIETKVREFHAKLLLSCFAAEAGFRVIIGDQDEMQRHLTSLPRGIYLDKSVVPKKVKRFRKNRDLGNRVVAWCEEGLVFLEGRTYLRQRISGDAFHLVDAFFAWGKVQAETIKGGVPEGASRIAVTGNPRFDMLRYPYRKIFDPEAQAINDEYGPSILVNTNFSRFNHVYGPEFAVKTMKAQGKIRDESDEAFYARFVDYTREMYHHFTAMVRHLSEAFPQRNIVVRPHPSENQETWREETRLLPNVSVVHTGNVIPWIMASDVLIHNSCTTGVEACLLGEAVLAYRPIVSEVYDSRLPNAVSRNAFTLDELVSFVEDALGTKSGFSNQERDDLGTDDLLEEYVSGVKGRAACQNIVSCLSVIAAQHKISDHPFPWPPKGSVLRRLKDSAVMSKRALWRTIKGQAAGSDLQRQKFPGLTLSEVQQVVGSYHEITDRFEGIMSAAVPGMKSCFLIRSDTRP